MSEFSVLAISPGEPVVAARFSKSLRETGFAMIEELDIGMGDMLLDQASRGYYPSTLHRVVNPPQRENNSRYSLPLFMHPRADVVLDHQTAGEFLEERLKEIGQS